MFNPNPHIQTIHIMPGFDCFVIDHALQDPQRWVQLAQQYRGHFSQPGAGAYPGIEMPVTQQMASWISDFFTLHLRRLVHARRTLRVSSRFSMVTQPPNTLRPMQWLCHRDNQNVPAGQCIAASVLYLFDRPELGGTSFFRPCQDDAATRALVHDSSVLGADQFMAQRGIAAGYMVDSNQYFERVLTVPAQFNRMIFYDGSVFHSGDIRCIEQCTDQPATGRLTLNGFYSCTQALA